MHRLPQSGEQNFRLQPFSGKIVNFGLDRPRLPGRRVGGERQLEPQSRLGRIRRLNCVEFGKIEGVSGRRSLFD